MLAPVASTSAPVLVNWHKLSRKGSASMREPGNLCQNLRHDFASHADDG